MKNQPKFKVGQKVTYRGEEVYVTKIYRDGTYVLSYTKSSKFPVLYGAGVPESQIKPVKNYQDPRTDSGLKNKIRRMADRLVNSETDPVIDDLIELCKDFATEDEVFAAISGTKYSTLYESTGF